MPAERFEVSIASEVSAGQPVQDRIMHLVESCGFSGHDSFGIRLALEEAIVNAMKHGNGLDPSKQVKISCSVDDERVEIVIEDEGPGFDPGDVPDPTEDDNIDKPSGRGLMLMRAFMTSIEYNERGNRVRLEKARSTGESG
ncbi:MAG: ATP-binding protein [Planctomycetaceae bacterium]